MIFNFFSERRKSDLASNQKRFRKEDATHVKNLRNNTKTGLQFLKLIKNDGHVFKQPQTCRQLAAASPSINN